LETAEIAIQASLTGHLVLSTIHTNDAPSTVTRLLDMGIDPYLVASSVFAILAQRLVRKVCPACGEEIPPSDTLLRHIGSQAREGLKVVKGRGCRECRQTGYLGRMGIFELLEINSEIRELILKRSSADTIFQAGVRSGMISLRQDGIAKICSGSTTIEEVTRVTALDGE
jgi:type II secretory ATPase GspE/PulE/Tfp pilus assembly ATPase PilB-like protein